MYSKCIMMNIDEKRCILNSEVVVFWSNSSRFRVKNKDVILRNMILFRVLVYKIKGRYM